MALAALAANDNLLPDVLLNELRVNLRGDVYSRSDAEFIPRTTIFNGNVVTPAKAVALPTTVADVSFLLKFCVKHNLSPSVKAGGYGTAGWSINGDIVIDLSRLNDIDIEVPSPVDGSFVGLRNMPVSTGKGKERAYNPFTSTNENSDESTRRSSGSGLVSGSEPVVGNGGAKAKRQRSPELGAGPGFEFGSEVSLNLPRNPLVARFLDVAEIPRPAIRRRLDRPKGEELDIEPERDREEMDLDSRSRESSGESGTSFSSTQNPTSDNSGSGSSTTSSNSKDGSTTATTPSEGSADSPRDNKTDGQLMDDINDDIRMGTSVTVDLSASDAYYSQNPNRQQRTGEVDSTPRAQTSSLPISSTEPRMFNVRSNDPFGYMTSSTPTSSAVSSVQHRSFEQTDFPPQLRAPPSHQHHSSSEAASTAIHGPSTLAGEQSAALNISPLLSSVAEPQHKNAYVTFGAGVKQKEIDIFTSSHPLPAVAADGSFSAIPYHIPLAAHPVGSSVMLLGGFGFLSRLHGLSIDNLVEAEMVLADGSIVYVSENENPELWWAIRGAGPAFGIITRYKAIAYPIPIVYAGNLIYNFHASTAASLIKHFRDCVKGAPPELYANVLLTAGPAGKGSLVVVQLCFVGTQQKGKEIVNAIASWDGEKCRLNEVSEKSFLAQQDSVAQILRGQPLITSLPDDIIHKTVNEFANTPVGCTWLFELAGGAVASSDGTCLPKVQREANFTIAAFHQWEMDDDDPLCVTTAEHWIYETLAPVSTGGPIPAFLGRHEYVTRIKACYGENWGRLCEIKKKYDPDGLFRNSLWPLDVDGSDVEPLKQEPPSPIIEHREFEV